jgi:hypothetical protein
MGKERGMESWREKERQVSSDNLRRYLLPGNCSVILKLWSYYLAFVNVSVTIMGKIHDFWSWRYPLTDKFQCEYKHCLFDKQRSCESNKYCLFFLEI